jgi:hypothetical protein
MFRLLYYYWNNTTDTPYIQSKLNMFFYINVRIFKIKLNSYISLAITSLNSLKYKQLKVYYNILNFEYFYIKFVSFFIFFYILIIFI